MAITVPAVSGAKASGDGSQSGLQYNHWEYRCSINNETMKNTLLILSLIIYNISFGQIVERPKTIHVFVALCDNINQGIVPVPELIGNGKDPKNNLYWGALYGVKNFFKNKSTECVYKAIIESDDKDILESILFKHRTKNIYLLAEAFDGERIKKCTEEFLLASNNNLSRGINYNSLELNFGGKSDLVVYVSHDGLMEFEVNLIYQENSTNNTGAIVLACASKAFFKSELIESGAYPVLWTTNLMAPEAYTLEAALNSWSNNATNNEIKEAAAQAYNKYQKCGINGARNLFATGFN